MKETTKITQTFETEHVDSIRCEICKTTYKGSGWGKKSSFDVLETTVSMVTGEVFPEGGSKREVSYDICPKCFEVVLIPFLDTFGAKPTETEIDM